MAVGDEDVKPDTGDLLDLSVVPLEMVAVEMADEGVLIGLTLFITCIS